jgi:hypothetical protein
MRTGRPKAALVLTDDERRRLDSLAHRSRSAPALARRARIILACAEGTDSKVVARRVRVTPGTVCKWRGRFIQDRELFRSEDAHLDWRSRLSAVAGVYLILAETTGRLYLGSATGAEGIWGRWRKYAATGHGGNALLKELLATDESYPQILERSSAVISSTALAVDSRTST